MSAPTQVAVVRPEELERLERIVRSRISGRIRGLELVYTGEGIVLRGQAPSFYVKQIAQQALMEATDMPISKNEIAVR